MKDVYKSALCCGSPDKVSGFSVVPASASKRLFKDGTGNNKCLNKKPLHSDTAGTNNYFANTNCSLVGLEQAGANVTWGYKGLVNTSGRGPIMTSYLQAGLCPVNVHWHLGTEHLSVGEFDQNAVAGVNGPNKSYVVADASGAGDSRRLAGATARLGFRCNKFNANDVKFTTEYAWQHCKDMHVGETYEVHWPHSAAGACGTPYQYQTPFYDGVFCTDGIISLNPLNTFSKIGVQAQIFTIVNDEAYFYPDLIRGAIVDGNFWQHVTKYTGSTTGTSRDNTVCSRFTPITWQVDRKCHLISASTFDKMCADMKTQADDMTDDLHAHGARKLVLDSLAADNHVRRV